MNMLLWLTLHRFIQAAESITKVAAVLNQAQVEQYYIPLLQRLSRGEWFTSRTSACALYAAVYEKVGAPVQDELRRGFTQLGSDDTPMVRRAAAKWLGVRLLLSRSSIIFTLTNSFPHSHSSRSCRSNMY